MKRKYKDIPYTLRDIVKSCVLNFSGGVLQYSVNERFSFE